MGCTCCSPTLCPHCHIHRESTDGFRTKSYSAILPELRPLDAIFFKSTLISSKFIRWVQAKALGHGEFSHVGIIVDSSLVPVPPPDVVPGQLYVLECTQGMTEADLTARKVITGVQLRRLDAVLKEYSDAKNIPGGLCACAHLKDNPLYCGQPARVAKVQETVKNYYSEVIHKNYEWANIYHLLLTIMKNPVKHRTDQTFFCSELVAAVYQKIDLFPAELDCETIAPVEVLCNGMKVTPEFEDPIVITK